MSVTKPWQDPSIAASIFAEQAREAAAVYTAFADGLAALVMPGDDDAGRVLREDAERARERASLWLGYAEALKEGPE